MDYQNINFIMGWLIGNQIRLANNQKSKEETIETELEE